MSVQYRRGRGVQPLSPNSIYLTAAGQSIAARRQAITDARHRNPSQADRLPQRAGRARRGLARSAIASAILAVAAGCASLEPNVAKAWKIEPVLNVAHALQSSQAYYTMGRYHDGSQAWDKSVDAYRKAIAVDAQNIEAYNALGVALARSGRLADAETTLRQAVALDPARAHLQSNLGYVLLLAGKPADAVGVLRAAVRQDVNNAAAQANLRDAVAQANAVQGATPEPTAQPVVADAAAPGNAKADVLPAASPVPQDTRLAALEVSVPMPITTVMVPAPVAGAISVASPLQVASVPAPLTDMAQTSPTPAENAAQVAAVRVIRVISQPTMGSLESTGEVANRPLVRQTLVRHVEPELPVVLAQEQAIRLEVSNGNGVTGMAARVGKWLGEQGIKTATLTNLRPYVQQTTTVQYRSGQEEAAQRVARSLPAPAEAAPAPTRGLRSDVRVVLGRDWVTAGACTDAAACRPESAVVALAKADR